MQGSFPIASRSPRGTDTAQTIALIKRVLEDGKAEDIVDIDLAGKTTIADRMIIASGASQRQVQALVDRLVSALKDAGRKVVGVEGQAQGDWVLVDLGDVIVHVFRPQVRERYNLEKMWSVALPAPMEAHA
jgi:ribosome-associated protein